jgi:hypothetical protein
MVSTLTPKSLQATFLNVLPRIESQARIYFRAIKCANRKADSIAEVVAIAWKWFCRLMRRGKDATQFVGALARLAARAVWSGRRVCGQVHGNDVMSPVAQRRYNFTVESLPTSTRQCQESLYGSVNGQRLHDAFEERLRDNTVTPPPDQAAFRLDFPAWLKTLTPRERRIIRTMMLNERTKELSRQFEVSPGRISQLRRDFRNDWRRFVGDIEEKVTG